MKNKKYIQLENTDYGYEIYIVNGNKTTKLRKQQKMIMYKTIRKFRCIKQDNNLIYPNYHWIMLHFTKEKIKSKPKKVNRQKSKQIISGVLIAATIITGTRLLDDRQKDVETPSITIEQPETTTPIIFGNDIIIGEPINTAPTPPEYTAPTIHEFVTNQNDTNTMPEQSTEEQDIQPSLEYINDFCYEFEKPNDKEALINAQNYMELFYKYEKIYGVDAKLLCAIGAQESSGIHYRESKNGGYATGIMGIEYVWANEKLRVFNFEANAYETIVVDYSRIGELEYNIKIGAAIFQNYFYHTLKNSDSVEETDYMVFTLQKYNMGPGNMNKILSCGGSWIDNRDMINAGDKYYFEHVLSRLDNDTIIKIRLIDGSYYNTKLTNTALEKHHSRS